MSRLGFYIVRIYSTLRDALTKEEEEDHLKISSIHLKIFNLFDLKIYLIHLKISLIHLKISCNSFEDIFRLKRRSIKINVESTDQHCV